MLRITFSSTLLVILFCFAFTPSAKGITFNFSGIGDWTDVARWSPSYPGTTIASGDEVRIGGTYTLNSNVTLNGVLRIFGGGQDLIIPNGFTFTVNNGGQLINQSQAGTFELGGILDITGYMQLNNGETLTILSTGEMKLNSGNSPNVLMFGSIINNGTVSMNNGILENATFNNGGNSGLVNNNIIQGEGSMTGTGLPIFISNAATGSFSPGSSPGCISTNGMTNDGKMIIEVNNTTACSQFDQITSTGTINLGGTLETSFGFTPGSNSTITFIDANTISGTFSSITPALPSGWVLQYNFPNSGEVSLVFDPALPVELISFEAKSMESHISLNWKTASESNNERFEIEESHDGRAFSKIGEVKGGGGTILEEQEYSFTVNNPRDGTSYYRLKQIDFDGNFEYSNVNSVNFKSANGKIGEFFPNPSNSGIVNLEYVSQRDEEIVIAIFDLTGKLILSQVQDISKGNNNLSFDFSALSAGVYIVKIEDERISTNRKLIIEK